MRYHSGCNILPSAIGLSINKSIQCCLICHLISKWLTPNKLRTNYPSTPLKSAMPLTVTLKESAKSQ